MMLPKSQLDSNLKRLDRHYKNSVDPLDAILFSKLALLELCGWIEEFVDDMVVRNARLREQPNIDRLKNSLKKVHGFEYENCIRRLMIELIGLHGLEKLEKSAATGQIDQLKNNLQALKDQRDQHAHTHLKGVLTTIDSPSVSIARLKIVYAGLRELNRLLKRLR